MAALAAAKENMAVSSKWTQRTTDESERRGHRMKEMKDGR
jgi:hypothetical protein